MTSSAVCFFCENVVRPNGIDLVDLGAAIAAGVAAIAASGAAVAAGRTARSAQQSLDFSISERSRSELMQVNQLLGHMHSARSKTGFDDFKTPQALLFTMLAGIFDELPQCRRLAVAADKEEELLDHAKREIEDALAKLRKRTNVRCKWWRR